MIICESGWSAEDAIRNLNKVLSSENSKHYSDTYDNDGKRVVMNISQARAISGPTIIQHSATSRVEACVTVFGPSSKIDK